MCTEASLTGRSQRGMSLIELIMFIVIVSVGIVGILLVMNVTVKSSADPMVRKQALAMAEAILGEVLAKDFANPTGGYAETAPAPAQTAPCMTTSTTTPVSTAARTAKRSMATTRSGPVRLRRFPATGLR
jgi:Tfp pilus assembly protein PilV